MSEKTMVVSDGGRGYRARVARVEHPRDENEVRRVLSAARREGRRICVRGAGKSQGGLTLDEDAVVIDTGRLNRILEIDVAARTARVQAGVTWDRLRAAIDPYGLSTRTSQSYGVFTIGGSVSVNAHGRNVDAGVLAGTVLSMRVMLGDGRLVEASRDHEPELFSLVLGGLGLFGVLLDVTVQLVTNDLYVKTRVAVLPTTEYPAYFADHVRADPEVHFHYARLSVLESEVWQRLFCLDYRRQDDDGTPDPVRPEVVTRVDLAKLRLLLWATRSIEWSRRNRFGWELVFRARPERVRRNNVGNEPWALLSAGGSRWADWLQEFFIPKENLLPFIDRASDVLREQNTRLLNTTIRFVPRNVDAFLSYARQDCFSLVTYHEQRLDPRAIADKQALFRRLLDCAIECGGSYYLCYHRFATTDQLNRAYPRITEFFALKRKYDPDELFTNQFYRQYGH
jgi:FAD/FMN-containing dehydrogenase